MRREVSHRATGNQRAQQQESPFRTSSSELRAAPSREGSPEQAAEGVTRGMTWGHLRVASPSSAPPGSCHTPGPNQESQVRASFQPGCAMATFSLWPGGLQDTSRDTHTPQVLSRGWESQRWQGADICPRARRSPPWPPVGRSVKQTTCSWPAGLHQEAPSKPRRRSDSPGTAHSCLCSLRRLRNPDSFSTQSRECQDSTK